MKGRSILLGVVLIACAGPIGYLFWRQELKYQLPTTVPAEYQFVSVGQFVKLPRNFALSSSYFLHFNDPDCPCSRFNARHLKSLIRDYVNKTQLIVVLPSPEAASKAKSELGDGLIFHIDSDGSLARACGVYSTPQAAIIDEKGNLFYRGNYNRSRYCTQRATNFAELSLIALLNNQPPPAFGLLATQSYGCEWQKDTDTNLELF